MAPKFGSFALMLCFLWSNQALRRKNPGNMSDSDSEGGKERDSAADALLDVGDFDYTAVISGMSNDPLKDYLVGGIVFSGQLLQGEKTMNDVTSGMLNLVGTAWPSVATQVNPLLGMAAGMLFGFATGVMTPQPADDDLSKAIIDQCALLFNKDLFRNDLGDAQEFLLDISKSLQDATVESMWEFKWRSNRLEMERRISTVWHQGCVHNNDTEGCLKWRRNGAALMTEIMYSSVYQSITLAMKEYGYDDSLYYDALKHMNEQMDMLTKHYLEYSSWSTNSFNFDRGYLHDVTAGWKNYTDWRYVMGKDKLLHETMPWKATDLLDPLAQKIRCFHGSGFDSCKAKQEALLETNKILYMDDVKGQLNTQMVPALKALCESLYGIWGTMGCARGKARDSSADAVLDVDDFDYTAVISGMINDPLKDYQVGGIVF